MKECSSGRKVARNPLAMGPKTGPPKTPWLGSFIKVFHHNGGIHLAQPRSIESIVVAFNQVEPAMLLEGSTFIVAW